MKVLVVEPSTAYRELISQILREDGIESLSFDKGKAAINHLKSDTPDLICVSHELGDIDSFQFIKRLEKLGLCHHVPKFLITSNNDLEFRRKCYDIGFTEILYKANVETLQLSLKTTLLHADLALEANVLYVEDVDSTAAYTTKLLQDAGWHIDHVCTAEDALDLLSRNSYDLLITDLILSGKMSGINLIEELRHGDKIRSDVPILALSGWNDLLRQVYVLQTGASDFISKPFHENDFIARALNLIKSKKRRDALFASQQKLQHKAQTDHLTELWNRHYINEYSKQLIEQANDNNESLSLLVIDIDRFKTINDTHGHAMGDIVLQQISRMMREHSRDTDLVGRWGGEEFVIIMPRCDAASAAARAEHFRANAQSLNPDGLPITVSIGIASLQQHQNDSFERIFEKADRALLQAKNSGRNRVVSS